jgi:hypothetical protein
LVMLVHLRMRWCLSGREGFGFLSSSRRACETGFNAFVEVKWLFSTAPDAKKRRRKGVTGVTGRATGRWIGRGWRVRSAHPVCRGSSTHTGASGRSRDRHVWSSSREVTKHVRSIGRGGASGHDRSDASDRVWVFNGINRTLILWRPVSSSDASGRMVSNAIQRRPNTTTVSGQFDRRVRSVRRQRQLVPNGSIFWGSL